MLLIIFAAVMVVFIAAQTPVMNQAEIIPDDKLFQSPLENEELSGTAPSRSEIIDRMKVSEGLRLCIIWNSILFTLLIHDVEMG